MTLIIHDEKKEEEIDFPVLRKYKDSDFTVLFTSITSGIVVASNCHDIRQVGDASAGWYPANNYNCWKRVTGKIDG